MGPLAHGLLAIDDGELQLVLDRQGLHMRRSRSLRLSLRPGEVVHVDLQRITGRGIAENQLPRELNFLLRDFV